MIPLLVNLQPAGEYLGEDFHRAGGVPACDGTDEGRLLPHPDAVTVNGKQRSATIARGAKPTPEVIRTDADPLRDAGTRASSI
jgi:dihydroxy-acid dehydratase